MTVSVLESFEAILAAGKDSASLRYALGTEYLRIGDGPRAIEHLRAAVAQDPKYSAAWKLLGKAQTDAGLIEEAMESYEQGIGVAEERGDVQAAREMNVFLKRLKETV